MSTGTVDPILPAFEFGGPNRSTHLADDYAVIEDTDGRSLCTGQANVQLDLLPTPRINAYVCVESHEPFSIVGRPAGLNLRSIGHPIPGFIGSLRFSTSTGTTS